MLMLELGAAVFVTLSYRFIAGFASVDYAPGMRPVFPPLGLMGAIIPTFWWNLELDWSWEWHKSGESMGGTGKLALEQQEVVCRLWYLESYDPYPEVDRQYLHPVVCGPRIDGMRSCCHPRTSLAIHQGKQQTAYEKILKQIPASKAPVLDDLSKLRHLLASAAAFLTRELTEDVTAKVARPAEKNLVFKKGALMIINMLTVQHNSHFLAEPEEYCPPNGLGPHTCLGRKFSHTEAMCFLVLLLRD
ncbi:hypothetical protein B0H17DRAFT_1144384 [Mycena rosella]|uniref:Cytochrome P450 n=1 Tax=Mycena rosella TaxID=1033263 RepID=A0AAD7CTB4_MYCRO|nr:hypothetical protein B0H17DRAFT_1144384 [Mycena rosella]